MASASSRTLLHYTPKKITSFHTSPKDQVKLLVIHGKPLGFWYAYGTNWRNIVEAGKVGRSTNTVAFRYEVTLPEESFITEMKSITPDTIFELSAANLDEFMEKFHNNDYFYSPDKIVVSAFHRFVADGGSHILDELADKDETGEFGSFLKEIREEIDAHEEIDTQNEYDELPDYIEIAYDRFYELFDNTRSSPAALRADGILNYNWGAFWKDVGSSVGGVEFHTDLFTIQEWNGLWLPWTDKLDVRSGVIFHPNTFRDGVLMEQILQVDPIGAKNGGRRRTRKGRGRRRNKTRSRPRRF